jgi:hypothetical protein
VSTDSDGLTGDAAFEALDLAVIEWDDDVTELSEHLSRLWSIAGEQQASISELHNVRAGLFGYGKVTK